MWWNSRFAKRLFTSLSLMAIGSAFAGAPILRKEFDDAPPVEMSFMKGDTRNGSKVHIRIVGDSLFYREVTYYPNTAPLESRKTMQLNVHRRKALNGVLGDLPRYPAFGTCFGRDMRFYMVETPTGKFYRSLPERSGKCYMDEPGIWSLLQDLDDLLAPPSDPDYQEYSAS
ncbi:MAG: hypothetical protein JWO30_661 [Fibrobacteres bacterium]|nr:hypothetical protein [Fibrobacterota bacterium]